MDKIDNKANCSFCSEENLNASLSCVLILNKNMNEQNISFRTSEIKINGTNKSIYIPKLNQINLNYKKEEENIDKSDEINIEKNNSDVNSEETDEVPVDDKPKRKKSNSSNKGWIISVIIVFCVILLGASIIFIYFLRIKRNNKNDNVNLNNITEQKMHDINRSDLNLSKN